MLMGGAAPPLSPCFVADGIFSMESSLSMASRVLLCAAHPAHRTGPGSERLKMGSSEAVGGDSSSHHRHLLPDAAVGPELVTAVHLMSERLQGEVGPCKAL